MRTQWRIGIAIALGVFTGVAARQDSAIAGVTPEVRARYLAQAQLWSAGQFDALAHKDLLAGPPGPGSYQAARDADGNPVFPPVTCRFVEPTRKDELTGDTPKFMCGPCPDGCTVDSAVKVKYGRDADANGEVYGEVIATRLFWALGFASDDMYAVRLTCLGCPGDPWKAYQHFPSSEPRAARVFETAVIERKYPGPKIEEANWPSDKASEGFGFDEVDAARRKWPGEGAPSEQWQGFRLLAAFIQHADNAKDNQRLACTPEGVRPDGTCAAPILMMQDVGTTFGGGGGFLGIMGAGSKARLDSWMHTSVWKKPDSCEANLSSRYELSNPKVSEAGRAFLSRLLATLTDDELRQIFVASRVAERDDKIRATEAGAHAATVDDWIEAFKLKRVELSRPCALNQ